MGIYQWTIDNFETFDAWCCTRGIDPLKLPAYRYYNLALHCLKENRDEDSLAVFEQGLKSFDQMEHPWNTRKLKEYKVTGKMTGSKSEPLRTAPVIDEEEDAARVIGTKVHGATGGMVDAVVPSWWRGDKANYAIGSKVAGQASSLKP